MTRARCDRKMKGPQTSPCWGQRAALLLHTDEILVLFLSQHLQVQETLESTLPPGCKAGQSKRKHIGLWQRVDVNMGYYHQGMLKDAVQRHIKVEAAN